MDTFPHVYCKCSEIEHEQWGGGVVWQFGSVHGVPSDDSAPQPDLPPPQVGLQRTQFLRPPPSHPGHDRQAIPHQWLVHDFGYFLKDV